MLKEALEQTQAKAIEYLLTLRTKDGYWQGRLSSSPFSTAISIIALSINNPQKYSQQIESALNWLIAQQNQDGGWGDTDFSFSNLPATILAVSAFSISPQKIYQSFINRGLNYINQQGGLSALEDYYGNDKTFSYPVKIAATSLGLANYNDIGDLPIELLLLGPQAIKIFPVPFTLFALPMFIAVGILQAKKNAKVNLLQRVLRLISIPKAVRILQSILPGNTGYLDSPLCASIVLMCLEMAQINSPELNSSLAEFILKSQGPDASWPIVNNLSVWNTALATQRLLEYDANGYSPVTSQSVAWLKDKHREDTYVWADKACGWPWTHHQGGLVDVDDTACVLKTLKLSGVEKDNCIEKSIDWLKFMQNKDGGWPTFYKGKNRLAFERSGIDLTAHALEALLLWKEDEDFFPIKQGLKFILENQNQDGSWQALWFGKGLYGAAECVGLFTKLQTKDCSALQRAKAYIKKSQNSDGGWGCVQSSVEDTALAISSLIDLGVNPADKILEKAIRWLMENQREGGSWPASSIGLYYESLFYYEELYPLIFSLKALTKYIHALSKNKAEYAVSQYS